jgi:LysR family hydrogen peroxide-inducible transcriptional activator
MPIHNKLIRTQELHTELLLVASSRKNDLITSASIRVKELDDFPSIALSDMHCLGEQIQSFCHLQGLELKVACDTSQLTTVQNCVALGLGVSLVPHALAASDVSHRLNYRTLSDTSPQRKIAAATRADRTPSFLAQKFIDIVREEYPTEHSSPIARTR